MVNIDRRCFIRKKHGLDISNVMFNACTRIQFGRRIALGMFLESPGNVTGLDSYFMIAIFTTEILILLVCKVKKGHSKLT